MALKRDTLYPGRFTAADTAHPQGAFKNRSTPTAQDGSYLEAQWANDWDGFFARILNVAGVTPNGTADTGSSSQLYDALLTAMPGRLLNVQIFTSSGTYTPTTNTKKIIVELVGAGGGGAGAEGTTSNISGGSGGGGGGYARYTTTTIPSTVVITVGTGGTRGNGLFGGINTNGSAGSSSSFGSLAVATGGSGGTYSTVSSGSSLIQQLGGNCGSGTTGELLAYGQPGGKLLLTNSANSTAGDGGASRFSFGPRAPGGGIASNGTDGRLGCGGTGALNTAFQSAGLVGGKGGDGVVLVWEYA